MDISIVIFLKKFIWILEFLFCIIEPFWAQIKTRLHIFLGGRVELKDIELK
jgi:hypothetical protein